MQHALAVFALRPLIASALAATVLFGATESAKADYVEWRGFVAVQGTDAACQGTPWAGTQTGQVRFVPSGLGTNGARSRLNLFFQALAVNVSVQGRFDRRNRLAESTSIGAGARSFTTTRLRLTQQALSNTFLSETTEQIRFLGQITNVEDLTGCNPTFEMTMVRSSG